MTGSATYAVEAERLTKVYQPPARLRRALMRSPIAAPITAVDQVDLRIAPGEVFGLLGPNGAGKTTLLKMLTTLLRPTSGSGRVAGFDLVKDEERVRRVIGLLTGEERSFYWRLSARQNLEFFAALADVPRRDAEARIAHVLELMGLVEQADDMFYSFSSGMKQKLGIARALLTEPEVLLLDEPTKAVDAVTSSELKAMIAARFGRPGGCTVLLATHRMDEAEALCDRIAILRRGRIIFCGTIPELRRVFGGGDECVVMLSGAAEAECARVVRRLQLDPHIDRPTGNGLLRLRFAVGDGPELSLVLRGILELGATVVSCERRERRLEDIFIDVVREAS